MSQYTSEQLAIMPVMDIALATQRFSQVAEFVKGIMKQNVDYGIIPGIGDKPTLLKPGAEKLTTFFGLTKRIEIIEKIEDWTGKDHNNEPFFYYLYRCSLYRGDMLIAEADGSCNSMEGKYRWRKGKRVCPHCGQETIIKGKAEYGGGWLCWQNKGGCGAKFADGDETIEGQEVGRVLNDDIASLVNTIQKIAQKRALVAVTLLAINASEFFTQDMEDYITTDYIVVDTPVTEHPAPPKQQSPKRPQRNGRKTPADDLFNAIQAETNNYYKSIEHLYNTLGGWPSFADSNEIEEAKHKAIQYANNQIDGEAAEE